MVQKYGTHNILNSKMLDAADKSKINDPSMRGADYSTSQVLDFWSQKIQEDFERRNTSPPIASDPDSLCQVVNIQSQQINTLVCTVASMNQKMESGASLTSVLIEERRSLRRDYNKLLEDRELREN
jgi:hypothetical protein